jgi:hypothetical protein
MTYMMSSQSYLGDDVGLSAPHLMFYLPLTAAAMWKLSSAPQAKTCGYGPFLALTWAKCRARGSFWVLAKCEAGLRARASFFEQAVDM